MPILGPVPDLAGYFNAAGGFRTGIVASPLTARLVAECITGERPIVDVTPFLAERFLTPNDTSDQPKLGVQPATQIVTS